MNIAITTFNTPFSFFCKVENEFSGVFSLQEPTKSKHILKNEVSDMDHGQYVAVMWKNKWTRGIVTMEQQFQIWLIDYGIYLSPNEKTVCTDLPAEYKKLPTKVFEASIHGVTPLDKVLTVECEIANQTTNYWNTAAILKGKSLIASAEKVYFVPIAIIATKDNDIVIGDLYLTMSDRRIVNFADELKLWPIYLQSDRVIYIQNLSTYYISRRKHRASLLKPEFKDFELPTVTLNTTLTEYNSICDNSAKLDLQLEYSSDSEDGCTVVQKDKNTLRLTAGEIEHYSNKYFMIGDRQYNVLNVLLNKIRDLNMCLRYKDHDLKSLGRANRRTRSE